MPQTTLSAAAVAVVLIVSASNASAAVTFGKTDFSVDASAHAGPDNFTHLTATTLPPSPLSGSESSMAQPIGTSASSIASGSVAFGNAASGHVTFDSVKATAITYGSDSTSSDASETIDYAFQVDGLSKLNLAYDAEVLSGFSDSFSSSSLTFYLFENAPGMAQLFKQQVAGAGIYTSEAFGPGSYLLSIRAVANAETSIFYPTNTVQVTGDVDFTIAPYGRVSTPLPEPASWALMICGLGMVGATLRRRDLQVQP